ncbi:hypothetical protein B0T19DRAFT_258361 [Cercophora scortea]|uniref:Uncharacterized protein n=1 Tax=Cercophora scortea TaxID=314031 RepID=A0AAE0I9Q0_9PEZI|nr:hypothetical protein B0T19DRAFT_258361 [Cercophora scortea]
MYEIHAFFHHHILTGLIFIFFLHSSDENLYTVLAFFFFFFCSFWHLFCVPLILLQASTLAIYLFSLLFFKPCFFVVGFFKISRRVVRWLIKTKKRGWVGVGKKVSEQEQKKMRKVVLAS